MSSHIQISVPICIVLTCVGSALAQNGDGFPRSKERRPFVVAGYLPNYRVASWSGQKTGLSDLIYFGLSMPADGRFDSTSIPNEHLELLAKCKRGSKRRVLLSVGGWEKSSGFRHVVADAEKSDQFIHDAAEFCVSHHLDGVDYDWEHPKGIDQLRGFTQFVRRTKAEFNRHKLLVTIAQAGWQDLGEEMYELVDRVHLMSYDHEFPQATFDKSVADVNQILKAGCPAQKVVLGLPFYGRDRSGAAKTYAEIASSGKLDRTVSIQNGFAFNGPDLIARKVRYARRKKLGGVMIWELGQDKHETTSLLGVIDANLDNDE